MQLAVSMLQVRAQNVSFALIVLLLVASSAFSLWRAATTVDSPLGATDLYPYWYAGVFLRQGEDPYGAYLRAASPTGTISYLDGSADTSLGRDATPLSTVPAQGAPFLLGGMALAMFPWSVAKTIWLVVNLGFIVLMLAWLLPSLMPASWPRWAYSLLILGFLGALATRVALGSGQTSILVLALSLLAILAVNQGRWVVAGLAAGIALSKYSLALPLVLYLIYRRQWRVLATALLVQVLGIVTVAMIGGTSPLEIVQAYVVLFMQHAGQYEIELRTLFPPSPIVTVGVVVILSAVVFGWLGTQILADRSQRLASPAGTLAVLSSLSMWSLLVIYHGLYDAVFAVLPLALLGTYALGVGRGWKARPVGYLPLLLLLGVGTVVLILPGEALGRIVPGWTSLGVHLTTLTLLALLVASLWLVRQVRIGQGAADLPAPLRTAVVN